MIPVHEMEALALNPASTHLFEALPEPLVNHIFSFLDGEHLARAREVSRKWNDLASQPHLWKALCHKKCSSLQTDMHLLLAISYNNSHDTSNMWRDIYPKLHNPPRDTRIHKTGEHICAVNAYQISGPVLGHNGWPEVVIIERRFTTLNLPNFVLPDAAVFYLEPACESDLVRFHEFTEYLNSHNRVGLALDNDRRYLIIPPCDYTREHIGYHGHNLLGVAQRAVSPLVPPSWCDAHGGGL